MLSMSDQFAPGLLAFAAVPDLTLPLTEMQSSLLAIDGILTAIAVVFLAVAGIWWGLVRRVDPLRGAPERPNLLREDIVAMTMLAYLTASLCLAGVVQLFGGDIETTLGKSVINDGTQLAGIAVCLMAATTCFKGGIGRFCLGGADRGLRSWPMLIGVTGVIAIGLCPLVRDLTIQIIHQIDPAYELKPHPTIDSLADGGQPLSVVIALWVGAVALAPLAEEMFFRGLIQTLAWQWFGCRWIGLAIASVLFAAVHYQQIYAVPALAVLAVLIGFTYERTGSLIPPIAIHALFNLKTLLWETLGNGTG